MKVAILLVFVVGLVFSYNLEADIARLQRDLETLEKEHEAFVDVNGDDDDSVPEALKPFMKEKQLLMAKAWADEAGRAEIIKATMDGLVNCPVLPKNGEEVARQMSYLAKHFVSKNPSADPRGPWRKQAMMAYLTEGTGDVSSTCGFLPNMIFPFTGYKGVNCAMWYVKAFSDHKKAEKCKTSVCTCKEPTFNRKYIVKAGEGGAPTAYDWVDGEFKGDLLAAKPKRKPPTAQHNFLAFMTWPTWTFVNDESLPQDGDVFFVRDTKDGDPGHTGIVISVQKKDPFSLRTADAGNVCGAPKSESDIKSFGKGFDKNGWQCLKGSETERVFSKNGKDFMLPAGKHKRKLEGFVNMRALLPAEGAEPEKYFSTETRWTTKEFCDIIYKDGQATGVVPPALEAGETAKANGDA